MKSKDCPFCNVAPEEIFLDDPLCFAKWDKHPVTEGHILIISKRHFAGYFDATPEESLALLSMVKKLKKHLDTIHNPEGYNIGVNIGAQAGQTIFHMHIHLIPRRKGDVKDPRGGVRNIIRSKGKFKKY